MWNLIQGALPGALFNVLVRTRSIACRMPAVAVIALVAGCAPAATSASTPIPAGSSPATAAPSSVAVAAPARPALTERFTSTIHGISVSYPDGWVPKAATEPWPEGEIVLQQTAFGDVIEDGSTSDTAFLALASQPLAGRSFDQWVAGYPTFQECGHAEPVVVDGARGVVGPDCLMALVTTQDRGYLIWLYRIDDPDWFEEILATVKLDPEAALDAAP